MNTFTPGAVRGSSDWIAARLSLLAPRSKPKLPQARPAARRYLSSSACAYPGVGGLVLGMSMNVVRPPATAAADSVAMSALYSRPGSTEMNLVVDHARQQAPAQGVDHALVAGAQGQAAADLGDAAVLDAQVAVVLRVLR